MSTSRTESLANYLGPILLLVLLKIFPPIVIFAVCFGMPCYILWMLGKEIQGWYQKKFIPWLFIRRFKNEFKKRSSPFFGWKYELLVPPLYFPWDEVISDKPLQKKIWIPEPEFHYDDSVYDEPRLYDEYRDSLPLGETYPGCHHENFITLYHRGKRKLRKLDYRVEGLLHICQKCQKQIGYDGAGLN